MSDSSNRQYDPSGPQIVSGNYASTGSPGSQGTEAGATAGPVIGTGTVVNAFASSQVEANVHEVPVHSGDTSGFSDDSPVHTSPLLPGGSPESYLATGSGDGSYDHHDHHNGRG